MRDKSSYKLCHLCDAPILRKGEKRVHPDDYRHAQGCPYGRHYERIGRNRTKEIKHEG